MSKNTLVTDQVQTAIANAHSKINAASQLSPGDESQLREMSAEISEKIDDLTTAHQNLSGFLANHAQKQPVYS